MPEPNEPPRQRRVSAQKILAIEAQGTEALFMPNEKATDAVMVRFPHDEFGAGHGTIRICRYDLPNGEVL